MWRVLPDGSYQTLTPVEQAFELIKDAHAIVATAKGACAHAHHVRAVAQRARAVSWYVRARRVPAPRTVH